MQWRTDILGDDFQACTFEAAGPDGVLRTATLVRHAPPAPRSGAVRRSAGRAAAAARRPGRPVPARLE